MLDTEIRLRAHSASLPLSRNTQGAANIQKKKEFAVVVHWDQVECTFCVPTTIKQYRGCCKHTEEGSACCHWTLRSGCVHVKHPYHRHVIHGVLQTHRHWRLCYRWAQRSGYGYSASLPLSRNTQDAADTEWYVSWFNKHNSLLLDTNVIFWVPYFCSGIFRMLFQHTHTHTHTHTRAHTRTHAHTPSNHRNTSMTATKTRHPDRLTVCAEAERGVRCTGVRLLTRLSHSTIWPE